MSIVTEQIAREHCKITGSGKTGVNVVRDRIMCIPRAKINVF